MDWVQQRQRRRSRLVSVGWGHQGLHAAPRSPGTSWVTVCSVGPHRPRVIYDPLSLPGGSGGSGLGPAAEGPSRGDREQRLSR